MCSLKFLLLLCLFSYGNNVENEVKNDKDPKSDKKISENHPSNHLLSNSERLDVCSRWYPTETKSERPTLRSPLLKIFKDINSLRGENYGLESSWTLMNNLFLPLPQRRRAEVALALCKNEKVEEECLSALFHGNKPKLLRLLATDKNEALAERLFHTLDSATPDFDILFDIILARPKSQLRKIINVYHKFYNMEINFENEKYLTDLEKHLLIKKNHGREEEIKIWKILYDRVESVNKNQFIDNEDFSQVTTRILKLCKNFNENIDNFIKDFGSIWHYVEFNSNIFVNFGASFLRKCDKIVIKEESETNEISTFLEYLRKNFERMLIVSGFLDKEEYYKDMVNRINNYVINDKFEELITLILIHHDNDLLKIMEHLKTWRFEENNKKLKETEKLEDKILSKQLENARLNDSEELKEEKIEDKDRREELENLLKEKKIENYLVEIKLKNVELNILMKELEKNKELEQDMNENINKVKSETELEEIEEEMEIEEKMEKFQNELNEKIVEIKEEFKEEEEEEEEILENLKERNNLNLEEELLNEDLYRKLENELEEIKLREKLRKLKFKEKLEKEKKKLKKEKEKLEKEKEKLEDEKNKELKMKIEFKEEKIAEKLKKIENENFNEIELNKELRKIILKKEDQKNKKIKNKLKEEIIKAKIKLIQLKINLKERTTFLEEEEKSKIVFSESDKEEESHEIIEEKNFREAEKDSEEKSTENEEFAEESEDEYDYSMEEEKLKIKTLNLIRLENALKSVELKENLIKLRITNEEIEENEENKERINLELKKMTGVNEDNFKKISKEKGINECQEKLTENKLEQDKLKKILLEKKENKLDVEENILENKLSEIFEIEKLEKLEKEKEEIEKEKYKKVKEDEQWDEEKLKEKLKELKEKLKIKNIEKEKINYKFSLLKLKDLETKLALKNVERNVETSTEEINDELIKLNFKKEEVENEINKIKLKNEEMEINEERTDLKNFLEKMMEEKNKNLIEDIIKNKYAKETKKIKSFDKFLEFYYTKFKNELEIVETKEKLRKIKLKKNLVKKLEKMKFIDSEIFLLKRYVMSIDLDKIEIDGETDEKELEKILKRNETKKQIFEKEMNKKLKKKEILEEMTKLKKKIEKTFKEKIKEEELKIILIKEKILKNRLETNEFSKELKEINKFINFDKDRYGLKTFFYYALSEKYKGCYGETENEFNFEQELENLEYNKTAKNQLQNLLKMETLNEKFGKIICDKFYSFNNKFERKYSQVKIEKRNDYETVWDWYIIMKNRIDELEKECLEYKEEKAKTVISWVDKNTVEKEQPLVKIPLSKQLDIEQKSKSSGNSDNEENQQHLIKSKSQLEKLKNVGGEKRLVYANSFSYISKNNDAEAMEEVFSDKKQNEKTKIKDILKNNFNEEKDKKPKTNKLKKSFTFPNFTQNMQIKKGSKRVTPIKV